MRTCPPRALLTGALVVAMAGCSAPDPDRAERAERAERLAVELGLEGGAESAPEGAVGARAEPAPLEPSSTAERLTGAEDEGLSTAEDGEPTVTGEAAELEEARFTRPEHVRGLYVNAWAAGSRSRMNQVLDLVRRTEVNSLVIDIKDATGYISHRTDVDLAHRIGATEEVRIRDLPGLLDRLEAEGVYPIARIVVVKDPLLIAARPDLGVQDVEGGVWIDSKDIVWLNLYAEEVWRYNVEIAREVAAMGFPEIQWDYIRFPDAPDSDMARAVFTGNDGRPRFEAVRGFLSYAQDELDDLTVRSTADVFGVTTSFRMEFGIGQLWETFIDVVDVALPMVYPSHYRPGFFGFDQPNAYPYEVVKAALQDALQRSSTIDGAGQTRPWLQDFTLGAPTYGSAEVRAQIQAVYDVGLQEWILWNPSTRYTEGALEPLGGFENEPLVRVAGVLAPVSHRMAVIDSVARVAVEERRAASDTAGVGSPR